MKKLLIPISALFATGLFYSQTSTLTNTENYVYSKTILDYDANNQPTKTSETVQYFDGLGRAKQIVNVRVSPLGKDVVTHLEYDGFGRQTKDFLPIPQSGTQNGGIYSSPLSNASAQYGSEKIYAEKVLENSPLDRIQQQIQAGNDWISKPVKFAYDANETNEVRKYITLTTTVENRTNSVLKVADDVNSLNGFYKTSQLYKSSVKDEDGNETIEFKNGEGQTVLVRKILDNTTSADTYYVYNEYNQLAFVIPPKASETLKTIMHGSQAADAVLNNLCYQYRYDGRNRLVEKKLPGKGWEFMVYDKQDRLVLSQDAVLGTTANNFTKKGWMFTKYDQFGRVVYTGFFANTASRNSMQTAINNMNANSGNNETRSTTAFNLNGMDVYYTKNAFPTGSMTILGVNYYDTYPNGTPTIPTQILEQDVLSQDAQSSNISTKSLPVASYVKNIEDDNWTKNYTWYDTKGRAIGSHSINHLGGYTKTESELDFAGVTKQAITRHKRLDSDTEKVITETFTYDNQNRLKTHTHQIDNNPIEYLAQNEYNELSQLQNKKVGGTNAATPLQSIDYEYNIRGWMTKINDPNNLGNDLFGYRIKYNQVEGQVTPNTDFTDLIVKPKYNGNIAEVDWKTSTSSPDYLRRYGYVYDGLNRLKAGFYQREDNPTAKEYFEKTDYDLNGNITSLKRSSSKGTNASASLIDNLIYTYNGNQLNTVTDSSSDYNGYPDTSGIVISYDLNGNMKNHVDKGIENINYNSLNLPNYFLFNYGLPTRGGVIRNNIQYLYKADGTKLRKIYNFAPPNPMGTATELSTEITDYIDGFQYKGNGVGKGKFTALLFYPTAEGYFNFENNKYIYNYNDHLGNVRLSYFKNDNNSIEVLEENNYYPFGLKHEGYNVLAGNPSYKYSYNGKELQETGQYDYGARFYMPDIGRWGVVDPLNAFTHDAYGYANNNPIFFNDPTGMIGECPTCPPKLNPNALGGENNPFPIQEVVMNAPIRAIASNPASIMPSNCLPCYSGNGMSSGIKLTAPQIQHAQPFLPYRGPEPGGGSLMMMSGDVFGFSDLIGLGLARIETKNKVAMFGVGLLAILGTKGRALDDVAKAEMAVESAEMKVLSRTEMSNIWGAGPKIDPQNLPKSVTQDMVEILKGNGTPIVRGGVHVTVRNNASWSGALEWKIKDVVNTSLNGSRIIQHPSGKWGLVVDHDYTKIIQIPTSSPIK